MSVEDNIQVRAHDVRLDESTVGVSGDEREDDADHLWIDRRRIQLVGVDARPVDEVTARGQWSLELQQRSESRETQTHGSARTVSLEWQITNPKHAVWRLLR